MIPQADVQAPPPPPPPAPPPAVAEAGTATLAGPVTTFAQLAQMTRRQLLARRDELSRQLNSASGRREDLVGELAAAPTAAVRTGLEQRISLLDQRILQLEQDIAINGQALAAKPTEGTTVQSPREGRPFGGGSDRTERVFALVGLVLLFPLAVAMARRIWRGATPARAHRDHEGDARLERIEQAVDAIAIEIERISEAQRFQNKLLSEGQSLPAFGFARSREAERVGGGAG